MAEVVFDFIGCCIFIGILIFIFTAKVNQFGKAERELKIPKKARIPHKARQCADEKCRALEFRQTGWCWRHKEYNVHIPPSPLPEPSPPKVTPPQISGMKVDPEGHEVAEEFAEVLEDLMDADHESNPDLNLEESEFADIIDEEEVKSAEVAQTIGAIVVIALWIFFEIVL